ncbi:hypothetical protein AB0D04_01135 [Streptomyces sp. NPDC048483]|uniref:hypothetical protein n=1 Tax=Streptomyces sp. NPDC048483 TaxID=3154927 RepID=UPI00343BDE2D
MLEQGSELFVHALLAANRPPESGFAEPPPVIGGPRHRHVPVPPRPRRKPEVPLSGDASEPIRPYALTPEELRQRRQRRRAKAAA